ncbi:MAG: DUF6320 domain-containing protein [Aminipila sp.]
MLYCEHCKIKVTGVHEKCPLCGCNLSGDFENTVQQYPRLNKEISKLNYILSLLKFAAIVFGAISIFINYVTYKETLWALFVVAGIACGWLVIAIGIPKKANLIKLLQWELYITCGLAVLWDVFTGWHRWSLEFVLPCASTACMVAIFILSTLLKKQPKEYLIYLTLVNILGFLPLLFLFLNLIVIKLPSIISVICSIVFMVGIFLFKRKAAYGEIKKKLHV